LRINKNKLLNNKNWDRCRRRFGSGGLDFFDDHNWDGCRSGLGSGGFFGGDLVDDHNGNRGEGGGGWFWFFGGALIAAFANDHDRNGCLGGCGGCVFFGGGDCIDDHNWKWGGRLGGGCGGGFGAILDVPVFDAIVIFHRFNGILQVKRIHVLMSSAQGDLSEVCATGKSAATRIDIVRGTIAFLEFPIAAMHVFFMAKSERIVAIRFVSAIERNVTPKLLLRHRKAVFQGRTQHTGAIARVVGQIFSARKVIRTAVQALSVFFHAKTQRIQTIGLV